MNHIIEITFCEDEIFSLPPPTLFFKGTTEGFLKLSYDLQELLYESKAICLNELDYIKLSGTEKRIIFQNRKNGNILSQIHEDKILSELDVKFWEDIFIRVILLSRSNSSSTYFIEFDNEDILEDCNMVLEV